MGDFHRKFNLYLHILRENIHKKYKLRHFFVKSEEEINNKKTKIWIDLKFIFDCGNYY